MQLIAMNRRGKIVARRYVKSDMNQNRARWVMVALKAFSEETGLDLSAETEDAIGDLLCDLGHLCATRGFNYDRLLSRGRKNFSLEAAGHEF